MVGGLMLEVARSVTTSLDGFLSVGRRREHVRAFEAQFLGGRDAVFQEAHLGVASVRTEGEFRPRFLSDPEESEFG